MKFSEWVEKNHPEALDEGFIKKAALALGAAGAIAAGASGIGRGLTSHHDRPSATRMDDFEDEDSEEMSMTAQAAKLKAAAQRVGIPKSQWNNLKGHMKGGVVTVVNGKKVPLTPKEAEEVRFAQQLARSMGN
jgi:hypothetical protein